MSENVNDILDAALSGNSVQSVKSYDDRIDETVLTGKEVAGIVAKTAAQEGKETLKDLMNRDVGNVIFKLIDIEDAYGENEHRVKAALLMGEYFAQSDDHEAQLDALKVFLKDAFGKTLYAKLLRILEDEPLDRDLIRQMSRVLAGFIKSENLKNTYSQNKYLLSLITRLSSSALALLTDHRKWVVISSAQMGFIELNGQIQGNWSPLFALGYLNNIGETDIELKPQIEMAFQELEQAGICAVNKSTDNIYMGLSTTGEKLAELLSGGEVNV